MINQESGPGDGLKKVPEPLRETTGSREEIEGGTNEANPIERAVCSPAPFATVATAVLTHLHYFFFGGAFLHTSSLLGCEYTISLSKGALYLLI